MSEKICASARYKVYSFNPFCPSDTTRNNPIFLYNTRISGDTILFGGTFVPLRNWDVKVLLNLLGQNGLLHILDKMKGNKLKFNCAQLRITICLKLLSVF